MKLKQFLATLSATFIILLLLHGLSAVEAQGPPEEEEADPGSPSTALINTPYRPSDSPWLRLPDDMREWPPALPPEEGNLEESSVADPTATELYVVATGETVRIPGAQAKQQIEEPGPVAPYYGLLPSGVEGSIGIESVIGGDDRSRITATTTYPWRTIVKLFMSFPGALRVCSGAVIDNYHVLTAGHCVHDQSYGGWAAKIRVVPGYDDGAMPYHYAWAVNYRSYSAWTVDQNSQHDWALITLDRNIGAFTGWMNRETGAPTAPIYLGTKNIAGYPTDLCSGGCLYFDADVTHSVDEYNHWYFMDTAGGQSGAPVWRYVSPNYNILTIHTKGVDGTGANRGTRLNQNKYDTILTWIGQDSPPADKADLMDDGPAFSSFSPATIIPGSTFNISSDVRNMGTAASGGFHVSYYASTNTNISTYDYLIGSAYVSSITAFNVGDSDWSGAFPNDIPPGTYWVGWIIDSGDEATEFDETNNIAYKDSYTLTVENHSLYLPLLVKQ